MDSGRHEVRREVGGSGDMDMGDAEAEEQPWMVAVADPALREPLDRENQPDPLAGEQTWPTEEELMEVD